MKSEFSKEQIKYFMGEAIKEAKKAEEIGEIPIGAILVKDMKIISRGHNERETTQKVTQHAELIAIEKANNQIKSWRLSKTQLFVTLEPCIMCSGLIQQARIEEVYFGASDSKAGGVISLYNLLNDKRTNHQVNVYSGIYKKECEDLLKVFFKKLRTNKKLT